MWGLEALQQQVAQAQVGQAGGVPEVGVVLQAALQNHPHPGHLLLQVGCVQRDLSAVLPGQQCGGQPVGESIGITLALHRQAVMLGHVGQCLQPLALLGFHQRQAFVGAAQQTKTLHGGCATAQHVQIQQGGFNLVSGIQPCCLAFSCALAQRGTPVFERQAHPEAGLLLQRPHGAFAAFGGDGLVQPADRLAELA